MRLHVSIILIYLRFVFAGLWGHYDVHHNNLFNLIRIADILARKKKLFKVFFKICMNIHLEFQMISDILPKYYNYVPLFHLLCSNIGLISHIVVQ